MINNLYVLCSILIFNFIVSLIIRVSLKRHFIVLKHNIFFISYIVLCNILYNDIDFSVKVGLRLFLALDYAYIMGCYFNPTNIRIAFKYLLYPLKIFKINIDSLTLIIAVSLTFIPILIDETSKIKLSLRSKGLDFKFSKLITRPHIYLITFFYCLFDRIEELEKSLTIKAY